MACSVTLTQQIDCFIKINIKIVVIDISSVKVLIKYKILNINYISDLNHVLFQAILFCCDILFELVLIF